MVTLKKTNDNNNNKNTGGGFDTPEYRCCVRKIRISWAVPGKPTEMITLVLMGCEGIKEGVLV